MNSDSRKLPSILVFALALGLPALSGCNDDGYGEKAGKKIDDAAEDVKDAGEDVGDKAEDVVDEAEDKLDEQK